MLSLFNAILIHHKSLSGRIRYRFAAGSARVFWAARDALVFRPNVPRHNPADDQGKDSEKLYKEDQHEFDSEDASNWVNCGRVIERVDDAVGGSNGGEG